jgi:glycerol-3-phosphate acyltransferase PlsX
MGGDHGVAITLPACRAFLDKHPQAELVLVGTAAALAPAADWPRTHCVAATEVVAMDDAIEVALRRKKDSSMRVAIEQLKAVDGADPAAHACVSAGNTGALMAVARYVLKTLEGIDRPAIATVLPNRRDGFTTVLDLGANVDCTPEQLFQFAVMGSALVAAVDGKDEPSVGLLNIGEEAIKGSETIKRAGELLRAAAAAGHLNFHGNVEGNDIFKGTTDIVVCDGFVGNVVLKAAEGMASMLSEFIRQEFTRSVFTRLAAVAAMPVLKHFKQRVDHRRYNGAALLGLRGLVFKSHGSADAFAFEHALARAYDAARNRLLDRVHDRILETLQALPTPNIASQAA